MGKLEGNGTGRAKDTGANRVADDYSESKANAQNAQKAACFVGAKWVPASDRGNDNSSSVPELCEDRAYVDIALPELDDCQLR